MSHRPPGSLLVAAALDPVLAGTPFAPGQAGVPRRVSELIGATAEEACAALAGPLTDLLRVTAATPRPR